MATDRFDLEQHLMTCWMVTDDLRDVIDVGESCSKEELIKILTGLRLLYLLRFERMFNCFETMIKDGQL